MDLSEKDLEDIRDAAAHVFRDCCIWRPTDQQMAHQCWLGTRENYWRNHPPRSWTEREAVGGEIFDCAIDHIEWHLLIQRKVH